MIKLEDLKLGDKVYLICGYQWIEGIEIIKEKYEFECENIQEPAIYVAIGMNKKGNITRYFENNHEERLYRTIKEAEKVMGEFRQEQKDKLNDKNDLIDYLFEKAHTFLTGADRKLIAEIIEENKSNL